jgi:Family of unknown function (DUF6166)
MTIELRRTKRGGTEGEVIIDGRILTPHRSQRLWNHSPTGFNWGYAGSGPAQLALALLLEAGADDREAVKWHQQFKFDYVQHWPADGGIINVDVDGWLTRAGVERDSRERDRDEDDGQTYADPRDERDERRRR